MIAEQYRNIKPHFAEGRISPLAFRWRCILLDQDTENPPFEPCRYFVVNVFAETRDQVVDCLGEEYPWCDIMVADRAIGLNTDDEFLESWLEYHDNVEQQPLREAPHGKEYPKKKTYTVWETCTATNRYTIQAENEAEAMQLVADAQVEAVETDYRDYEITEVLEVTDDNNQ